MTSWRNFYGHGFAIEVVELVEYAHARAEKAVQHVDDSDGWITEISVRLGDLHVRACTEARIDPVALARRLVKLELAAELDTFHRATLAYADALGPAGIDEYRRLIEPRFRGARAGRGLVARTVPGAQHRGSGSRSGLAIPTS